MIWDKLAHKYDKIWLQKYSLEPTRKKVHSLILKKLEGLPCAMVEPPPLLCILDIGCGTGQFLLELHNKYDGKCPFSLFLVGIDKSKEMLKIAQTKMDKQKIIVQEFQMGVDHIEKILDLLPEGKENFDIITCCHSFPYYENKEKVLKDVKKLLSDNGTAYFFQASINSFYDKIIMSFIEMTAEKADYLSKSSFITLAEGEFKVVNTCTLKEIFYAPSICGFELEGNK